MLEQKRKSGLKIIGDISWGTHACLFYRTQEELLDILVPYFKTGLENNEFCLWVTSEPLSVEKAKKMMRKAMPEFEQCLEKGQIEIVPHTEWYLKGGTFNPPRVLNAWIDKLNQALAKGYDGLRITGNAAGFKKRDWQTLADYEAMVNNAIGKYQLLAICSYPLDRCNASDVIEVASNHQSVLIRQDGEWKLILMNARDVQEFRKMQAQIIQAEKVVAVAQLGAGVAHDINNPLETIIGFAQLLMREIPKDDSKYEDLLKITAAALRCKKTVESLLEFSRPARTKFKRLELNQLIKKSLSFFRQGLGANTKIKVFGRLQRALPPILGSSDQLERVFINILTNARNALPKGGKILVSTKLDCAAKNINVIFRDNGVGITGQDLPRIFEPFFSLKKAPQNVGLGLAICKTIIEKHRGSIEVESKLYQGTTLTIKLPVFSPALAPLPA